MKKDTLKITLVVSLILIEVVSIFLAYQSYLSKPKETKVIRDNKSYAIMLEDKDHLGTYNEYMENTWPGEGYILNIEMSSCVDSAGKEMEGLLTFDNEERIATVKSKKETYCYLYFKYDPAPVELTGFSITPVKTNNGKKYTNIEKNHVTLDWTDDDIQYYCLTESEEKPKIACDGKWTKSNGVKHIEVDYIFENKTNEDKKVYAYTKDFGGSPSPKKEDKINYDTTGPTVTPTPNGTKNSDSNSWYKTMNITLTGDDGIGIGMQNIKYCITTNNSCTPDKTLNGGSGVVSLPTDSKNQKVCYQGEDLLGQKGAANTCMSTTYQVDGSKPGITFSEGSKTPGENGWVKDVTVKATGSDDGSGVGSIKTCITSGATCTPGSEENRSDKSLPLGDGTTRKLCAEVIDKAGNSSGVICSNVYNVDGSKPSCEVVRGSGTTNEGLNVTVKCNDDISGCPTPSTSAVASKPGIVKESFTQTYTVKDRAGNTQSCNIEVNKQPQKSTVSCKTGKTCNASACTGGYYYAASWCSCASKPCSFSWSESGYGICNPGTKENDTMRESCSCQTRNGRSYCTRSVYSCTCNRSKCAYECTSHAEDANKCGCQKWYDPTSWSNVDSCAESSTNTSQVKCQTLYS